MALVVGRRRPARRRSRPNAGPSPTDAPAGLGRVKVKEFSY